MSKKEKTARQQRAIKAAVNAGIGLAAGIVATAVGVACITSLYVKTLTGIQYIGDSDIYDED